MFIVLLPNIVNASNHIKCASLSNQKCKIQPALISLHPNEYSQELHWYPFAVELEAVIVLMNHLIKHVFQIKQKIKIYKFLIWLQEKLN